MYKTLMVLFTGITILACNSCTSYDLVSPTSTSTEEITGEETKQVVVLAPTAKPIEATQIPTEAKYVGEQSYADKTSICTCPTCGNIELQARIIISEDGFVTGELTPLMPSFSGTRDNITGTITDDETNNCNALCTSTLTAKLTNDDQTFIGIVDESCTPGDCEFNNCVGTYTFSLNKK